MFARIKKKKKTYRTWNMEYIALSFFLNLFLNIHIYQIKTYSVAFFLIFFFSIGSAYGKPIIRPISRLNTHIHVHTFPALTIKHINFLNKMHRCLQQVPRLKPPPNRPVKARLSNRVLNLLRRRQHQNQLRPQVPRQRLRHQQQPKLRLIPRSLRSC